MTPPPSEVVQWLKRTYPRPSIDPEWLEGCYTWIQDELHLNPTRDMPAILENVDTQLLESDLADSMVAGTGIPQDALGAVHAIIKGPILVEIVSMTDIGHSAGTLLQVYESRVEYKKQAELRHASGDEEQQKPMPKYPRSMLQFQLSDGVSVMPAIEAKCLPQFELGETPLGFKMIIKNVTVRRGTALLEPRCVEVKGHRTADRDERRDAIFLRVLKQRLGEENPEDEPSAEPALAPVPAPVPIPLPDPTTPPRFPQMKPRSPTRSPRPPLAGIAIPPEPKAGPSNAISLNLNEHADDTEGPRRRKLPSRVNRSPSPDPPPRDKDLQRSRYFAASDDPSSSSPSAKVTLRGPGTDAAMKEFARSIGLSPQRGPPIEVPDTDEEEDVYAHARVTSTSAVGTTGSSAPKADTKNKSIEPGYPETSSDGFESEFVMDDTFFAAIDQTEEDALKRDTTKAPATTNIQTQTTRPRTQSQSQTQIPTQMKVKTEVLSQATSATLYSAGAAASSTVRGSSMSRDRNTPASVSMPGSRAMSVPGTSSGGSKGRPPATDAEVIDISDDEDGNGKENIPIQTRHVRRRVARWAGEDIIELSD